MNTKSQHTDPVTGDEITRSEHLTRLIQDKIIRTWWFLGLFTLTTIYAIVVTILAGTRPSPLDWWNVWASWTAVIVEGLIGRYMTGQTRRDAKILRELRQLIADMKALQERDFSHQEADYEVSLDASAKLSHILDVLHEGSDHEDLEPFWGEWNEE